MYYITIYDDEESAVFEMLLNQKWLGYEKKRKGFFKVIADGDDIYAIHEKVKWDKILRVA